LNDPEEAALIRAIAVAAFLAGLLLAVRVMFFGVRRQLSEERLYHRKWPLSIAAFLCVVGAMLYARADDVTGGWMAAVALAGALAAFGAWKLVEKSAAVPSTDPEDDPKYRFQGHVARVTAPIVAAGPGTPAGRIVFEFDGRRYDLAARWSPEADLDGGRLATAAVNTEVVIEFIDGDVAYVEPWAVVEQRI
jgi:hypothetical protein